VSVDAQTAGFDAEALAWDKQAGLLPAIVQDADTQRVLMLGYMDRDALDATLASGRVTFFSRSRQRLWTKGETSGHMLELVRLEADCDRDTLLRRRVRTDPPAIWASAAVSCRRQPQCWWNSII
jgi:phosphoribosyl-ATP pyrophosphohydrolase/phosphoribosyl-AMP cyclohydrolase